MPQPSDSEPLYPPAILIYGDHINELGPDRRQKLATALAVVVGAEAIVWDGTPLPVASRQEGVQAKSDEPLAPFSLVIGYGEGTKFGWEGHVALASGMRTHDLSLVKAALTALCQLGRSAELYQRHQFFTFQLGRDTPTGLDLALVRGITFVNPQQMHAEYQSLADAKIENIGPARAKALGTFVAVITQTWTSSRISEVLETIRRSRN